MLLLLMKNFFSKENILNFVLLAVASAVGVVVLAPLVSKYYAKLPFNKA